MRHDQKMGNGKVLSFMKLFLMANRGSGTTTKHGLNTAFLLCLPQAKSVIPTQLTPLSYSCSEINQAGPLYWKKIPALFPQTIFFWWKYLTNTCTSSTMVTVSTLRENYKKTWLNLRFRSNFNHNCLLFRSSFIRF